MLAVAQPAPMFRALNQNEQLVTLTDFLGVKNIVLYFYPKDDTPGCTIEANAFTALAAQFAQLNTQVIGVSKDDSQSHCAFIAKFNLNLQLLADTRGELCESYGVWREREKNGVKSMAILRSTFIIDKQGVLVEVMYGVNPEGHGEEVLAKLQTLGLN